MMKYYIKVNMEPNLLGTYVAYIYEYGKYGKKDKPIYNSISYASPYSAFQDCCREYELRGLNKKEN